MRLSSRSAILSTLTSLCPLFALTAHAAAESDPETCTRLAESDGLPICLAEGGGDPWIDDAWQQTGADTWTNYSEGVQSTWVETAPNDYEIVDTNLSAQQGATVPLPPPPPPPLPPPSGPGPSSPPPAPMPPPLDVTVGDWSLEAKHLAHGGLGPAISARTGPFGPTRMVVNPPTSMQYKELEFAWSIHKANATRPYQRVGIVISQIETQVNTDPPAPEPEFESTYKSFDELFIEKIERERQRRIEYQLEAERLEREGPTSFYDCYPNCGPLWEAVIIVRDMIKYPFEYTFSVVHLPEGDLTLEWLIDTAGDILDAAATLDAEHFAYELIQLAEKPALYTDPSGETVYGDTSVAFDLARAMLWFLDLVNPRDGQRLSTNELLYRETVVPFLQALIIDTGLRLGRGEITAEQFATHVYMVGQRFHAAVLGRPLMSGLVSASELGGLRPVAGALYVTR